MIHRRLIARFDILLWAIMQFIAPPHVLNSMFRLYFGVFVTHER